MPTCLVQKYATDAPSIYERGSGGNGEYWYCCGWLRLVWWRGLGTGVREFLRELEDVRRRGARTPGTATERQHRPSLPQYFRAPCFFSPLRLSSRTRRSSSNYETENFGHFGRVLGSSQVGAARLGSACACLPPRSLLCQDITRQTRLDSTTRLKKRFCFCAFSQIRQCQFDWERERPVRIRAFTSSPSLQAGLSGWWGRSLTRPFEPFPLLIICALMRRDCQSRFRPLRTVLPGCRSVADIRHPLASTTMTPNDRFDHLLACRPSRARDTTHGCPPSAEIMVL
jgi:hypothetical protein